MVVYANAVFAANQSVVSVCLLTACALLAHVIKIFLKPRAHKAKTPAPLDSNLRTALMDCLFSPNAD